MGKKILDSKILYAVLSILISMSLWLWVTERDENRERHPYNLPITFEGVDILEERGLMLVTPNVTANLYIRATPMVLAAFNENPPKLTANVSNISTEGAQRVAYSYSLPAGISENDVEISARNSSGMAVDVDIARFLRRENVEIQGEFQGSAAEGYLPGDKDDFRFSPATLTISGRADQVNQVAYAKVIITDEELTEAVGKDMPFQLIGASGDPLDNLDVTCDVDMIYTSFPIRATAEIPLEVKVIEGGGLRTSDVKAVASADSIMVAGAKEAVDGQVSLGAITVATIDLASLDDDIIEFGGELTFPIPLDDQLENLSGITEVKVTLKVNKRVETREYEASRISFINAPEGWTPTIITQAVRVKIRGAAALLDELEAENIGVVADLRDINPAVGPYTVSASINLNSVGSVGDVGVVNPRSYTVVVSLTRES